jgi:DNA-binding transcriptional MerR regulator
VSERQLIKAPDAFRTISEVAGDLELPQHVLRFWETRFTQIKPMKRGGGRRYYRPEDVNLLRGIQLLLYSEGYTIRGVQRLLKDKGAAFVAAAGEAGSVRTLAEAEPSDAPVARASGPSRARTSQGAAARSEATEAGLAPAPPSPSSPVAPGVAVYNRRRMEGVLAELTEAKRLLDQAR